MALLSVQPIALFLSTPSARRATRNHGHFQSRTSSISIHALREEGDNKKGTEVEQERISIHALREEGDSKNREKILCFCLSIYQSAQNW